MLLSSTLFVLVHVPLSAPPSFPQERRAEVRARYHELYEGRDASGLAQLWKEHPDLVLHTIDGDLEGGLALWEKAPESPDREAIRALYDRALFGALAAREASGHPILLDYASAFVGWDDEQKRSFRAGQAMYKRALEEVEAEDWDEGIMAAQECRERAAALGDWWGVAMGHAAEGSALRGGAHHEEALVAQTHARLLYHDLGLVWSEYRSLREVVELLRALERWPRARAAAQDALALARSFEDAQGVRDLLRVRLVTEERLGLVEEAAATRGEIEALGDEEPR